MKSKWFEIDEETKTIKSVKNAYNTNDAWEKTLQKWGYVSSGYVLSTILGPFLDAPSCGLCNNFVCSTCPCQGYGNKNSQGCQLPEKNAEYMYLFLLFVREATK